MIKTQKRKQVSVDFLTYAKNTINDLLASKIPQSTKQKLCIMIEKMLCDTKTYDGFRYLYWTKYGKLDWDEAKQKKVFKEIPKEYVYGPDDTGSLDFISDIQGEYSRYYFIRENS
jgi:hypothetical protein